MRKISQIGKTTFSYAVAKRS